MDGSIPQKTCKKCGKTYPATSEYFRTRGDRLLADCRACERERQKHWCEKNPEYGKRYREENPEKRRETSKRYYKENREKRLEHKKRYYEENREKVLERNKRHSEENPEQMRAAHHRRRARLANADGTHTAADIEIQVASQTDKNGRLICWWCGKPIKRKYHVDHRIPLAKGGSNDPGNLCITHAKCNLSKHDKMPWEFNGRLL